MILAFFGASRLRRRAFRRPVRDPETRLIPPRRTPPRPPSCFAFAPDCLIEAHYALMSQQHLSAYSFPARHLNSGLRGRSSALHGEVSRISSGWMVIIELFTLFLFLLIRTVYLPFLPRVRTPRYVARRPWAFQGTAFNFHHTRVPPPRTAK